ncbi:DUF2625 family protein [Asanoa sp. WMMD1127]|uniref:DUF2625 family protein n=1 Tax=Asanoa sp. WMMD1127 TaxID=3016107 RepID=UPI0024166B1D|nr:DUF2625 family protein [Asanoa sp. WMMD1127]MDG4825499.1 DUF2625 family protein [Asanoa sp. WMMD1127]
MERPAWDEIADAVAAAPYPVQVLPADPRRSAGCLARLEITTRSWLGAVVANSGGLLVDHGWLRALGGGHDGLPDVAAHLDPADGRLVVGFDVLGGQFTWSRARPQARPTIHYFGPEDLALDDLEVGYAEWLDAMLGGALTAFYSAVRWPGWEDEVLAVPPDQGISLWPPPWTSEGKDLSAVSRRPIPLAELVSAHADLARQLGFR